MADTEFPCYPVCIRCREAGSCTPPPRSPVSPRRTAPVAPPETGASGEGASYAFPRNETGVTVTLTCGHEIGVLGATTQLGVMPRYGCRRCGGPAGYTFRDVRKVRKNVKPKRGKKSEVDGQEEEIPY
jgi:hypothetical protein